MIACDNPMVATQIEHKPVAPPTASPVLFNEFPIESPGRAFDTDHILKMISPHEVFLNLGHSNMIIRPARQGQQLSPIMETIITTGKVYSVPSSGETTRRYIAFSPRIIEEPSFVQDAQGRTNLMAILADELAYLRQFTNPDMIGPFVAKSLSNPNYRRRMEALEDFMKLCVEAGYTEFQEILDNTQGVEHYETIPY